MDEEPEVLSSSSSRPPIFFSLGYPALTLTSLGYPDRAKVRLREMLAAVRRLNDAFILGNALCITPLGHLYLGDGAGMQEQAEALAALAEEHGFLGLLPLAAGYHCAGLILQGRFERWARAMSKRLNRVRVIRRSQVGHGGDYQPALVGQCRPAAPEFFY